MNGSTVFINYLATFFPFSYSIFLASSLYRFHQAVAHFHFIQLNPLKTFQIKKF
jgi:hypothetical protein